ncbi:sensor histidine kinase [Acidovorax facilis]|uniref:sensor histidine kinase n=1 Tax=Acidovorax facilis TaxID=12917 RepID=UPI003CF42E16
MYLSSTPIKELWPNTLKGALRATSVAIVFWALAATLLYLLSPGLDTWPRLLVFSECVGLTMVASVLILRRVRAFSQFRPARRWILTGAVSIPAGYFVGHQFAFLALGESQRLVGHLSVSFVPIIFTLLVGGLGLHSFATREKLTQEATARSEAQRLAVESELRLLRTQLEPHMLFNTLANLRSLVREDPDLAESMIDQLIIYLRSALVASQTDLVTLSREFSQLRAYLEIMALRMGPRLSFQLDLPAPLESATIPPMLLQPLVENAIKHGLEPKIGSGTVEVVARATTEGIEIRVNDSGLGLTVASSEEHADRPISKSYGLQHVRDRLRAAYGTEAKLSLERRQPFGVSAVVAIPHRASV